MRAAPFREARGAPTPGALEALAVGGVLALGVARVLDPDSIGSGPVVCPVRRLTGLPCPGCGLTRSWVHLVHGDLVASVSAHPFGWVLVTATVVAVVLVVRQRLLGAPPPDLRAAVTRPWVLALVGLWLAFALTRVAFPALFGY